MRHRTTDLAKRAAHIADMEAQKVWRKTEDYDKWSLRWQNVYCSVLTELQDLEV